MQVLIAAHGRTETVARSLCDMLTAAGHAVTLAISAKDLFADGVPDLVHACGAEAAAAVSAACVHQHVPLVATEPDVPAADALSKRALIRLCRSFSDTDALFAPDAAAAERLRRLTGYPVSVASDAAALTAVYEDVLDSYRLPPPPVPETGEPLVSVILPVYNTETYVGRCLDSLLAQTYRNLEILAVDDGSTDGSGAVLDAYAQKDVRLRVFHRQNAGVSAARNLALEHMTGEYVGFIDNDDFFVTPDMYETLVKTALSAQADIVECSYCLYWPDGKNVPHTLPAQTLESAAVCLRKCIRMRDTANAVWNKLYRRPILTGVVFPAIRYGEDYLFNVQAHRNCRRKIVLPYLGYYYAQLDDNFCGSPYSVRRMDVIQAMTLSESMIPPYLFGFVARWQTKFVLWNYWKLANSDLSDKKQHMASLRTRFRLYYPRIFGLAMQDLQKSKWYLPTLLFRIHPKLFLLAMRMLRVAGVE